MVPRETGEYTIWDRGVCKSEQRRKDCNAPKWGGVPTVDTRAGDNTEGIAQLDSRPLQDIVTEQGLVRLPYGELANAGGLPSTCLLDILPFTGSRHTEISDRYYR